MQRHLCSSFNSINDTGSSYLFIFPVNHSCGSRALLLFFAAIAIFVWFVGFCLSVSAEVVYGPKCAVNRLYNKNCQFLYFHLTGITVQCNINTMSKGCPMPLLAEETIIWDDSSSWRKSLNSPKILLFLMSIWAQWPMCFGNHQTINISYSNFYLWNIT